MASASFNEGEQIASIGSIGSTFADTPTVGAVASGAQLATVSAGNPDTRIGVFQGKSGTPAVSSQLLAVQPSGVSEVLNMTHEETENCWQSASNDNPILATALRLIDQITSARTDERNDDLEECTFGFYSEAPMGTFLGTNDTVAAGFAQALFGSEVVGSLDEEARIVGDVVTAFQIAQTYLIAANRRDSAAAYALETLALAIQRRNVASVPSQKRRRQASG